MSFLDPELRQLFARFTGLMIDGCESKESKKFEKFKKNQNFNFLNLKKWTKNDQKMGKNWAQKSKIEQIRPLTFRDHPKQRNDAKAGGCEVRFGLFSHVSVLSYWNDSCSEDSHVDMDVEWRVD